MSKAAAHLLPVGSPSLNTFMNIFKANLSGYLISADPATNTVCWEMDGSATRNTAPMDYQQLPDCFGRIVGITTRPRPDAFMLIFFERGVYAMDCVGSLTFSFRPLLVE